MELSDKFKLVCDYLPACSRLEKNEAELLTRQKEIEKMNELMLQVSANRVVVV